MKKDDGGPAFPGNTIVSVEAGPGFTAIPVTEPVSGMTLRDWFAGQALAGEMATWTDAKPENYAEKVAARCYAMAAAMLAERAKE